MRERIASLATRQAERLALLVSLPGIRNTRQLGTIAACEVEGGSDGYLSNLGPRLLAFFRDHDLLLRPLGNTVYIMPPYCIEDGDLDLIYSGIAEASELD